MENNLISTNLGVPKEITIGQYKYTFKKQLKGEKFSYRCFHRKCPVLLTITRNEINKIMNNTSSEGIKIECINDHNMNIHKNIKTDIINTNEVTLSQTNNNIAETLIISSIDKPLEWHITNLEANHIELTKNQIKYLLYKNRNELFPNDKEFIYDITDITINLDEDNTNKLQFCWENSNYYDKFNKIYKLQHFIIFTCIFLIKIFITSNQLYIDATFKITPKAFYQTLIIIAKDPTTKLNIPCFYVPMSGKNYELYDRIFKSILKIIKNENIEYNTKNKIIMCDFELNLRKALINNFQNCTLKGCYFHYIKNLWMKAKKIGLSRKKYIKKTKIIIFALKLITLIKPDKHKEFFEEIKFYSLNGDKIEKELFDVFLKYFEKNWLNKNYIKFALCVTEDLEDRTNNICEGFNNYLSHIIEIYKPRISYFTDKIKIITKKYYKLVIDSISGKNSAFNNNENIYLNIYYFLYNFHLKYKTNICMKNLLQLERDFEQDFNEIAKKSYLF